MTKPKVWDHDHTDYRCQVCKNRRDQRRRHGGYIKKNACEVCGSTEHLRVDHDHECCPPTGNHSVRSCGECVRGTLCHTCNMALTREMTPARLRALADYLERYLDTDRG